MPTYQYACTECGHDFEQFQSFSDDALTECPVCEGRLRKVFNAVGVVFKGSGFYRNDSRTGAKEKATAGADGDSGSGKAAEKDGGGGGGGKDGAGASDKPASDKPAAAAGTSSSSSASPASSTAKGSPNAA